MPAAAAASRPAGAAARFERSSDVRQVSHMVRTTGSASSRRTGPTTRAAAVAAGAMPSRPSPSSDSATIVSCTSTRRVAMRSQTMRVSDTAQPFEPVRAIDSMIWRWKIRNTASTGSSATSEAAMING